MSTYIKNLKKAESLETMKAEVKAAVEAEVKAAVETEVKAEIKAEVKAVIETVEVEATTAVAEAVTEIKVEVKDGPQIPTVKTEKKKRTREQKID